MPSFSQPPDWWVGLANLTQWLFWPAWSAIFSFLALLWALRIADRSSREARKKEAVFIAAVCEVLKAAVAAIDIEEEEAERIILLSGEEKKEAVSSYKRLLEENWKDDGVLTIKTDFPLKEFPSLEMVKEFRSALLSLDTLIVYSSIYDGSEDRRDKMLEMKVEISESVEKMELEADRLHLGVPTKSERRGIWSVLSR